jgi:hypothetical protein
MEPIAISVRGKGEWVVIHRCTGCGELKSNRAAGDDSPLLLGFSAAYSSFLRRLQDAGVDPEGIFAALEEMKVGLIDTATLMEAETGGVDP